MMDYENDYCVMPEYGQQDTSAQATDSAHGESEAVERILKERADHLAVPRHEEDSDLNTAMVVEFVLAGERYVLDAGYVHEIAPLDEVVPLPGAPEFVMGIISLRGEIQSVIDLRRLFDLPEDSDEGRAYAVILRSSDMEFGLYADEVPGVGRIALETVRQSLPTLSGIREELLKGVTGEGVVYLNAARLLSDERIIDINQ